MSKVFDIIEKEAQRQNTSIELIASENFVSEDVMRAVGSILTNKYTEGYPGNRYYGGCENYDELENYCKEKWQEAFGTDYLVNVQAHSGSSANMAALMSVLKPGDTMMAMDLNHGGHLTHGSAANFSGKLFNVVFYGVDDNGYIDMEDVRKKAEECQPKLILAGASAYSRVIPFDQFAEIAHSVGAVFMVDMAHIAGLIVAGEHPTPFGYADIVTTTTHKTLRGPRGGLIFATKDYAKKVDSTIFPGIQGGSLMHVIAGKAVAAEEACRPEFKEYGHQIILNARAMCEEFVRLGYDVVTGGTDNHMFLLDFTKIFPNLTGRAVQDELDKHGITLNKNCVPNEKRSPKLASGVRVGLPAMTTKGWKEQDAVECARKIDAIIRNMEETKA